VQTSSIESLKRLQNPISFCTRKCNVKTAIANAIKRKHSRVEEADILDAERNYSDYAIDSILVEDESLGGSLQKLIYEFMGHSTVLWRHELDAIMTKAGIEHASHNHVIEQLCKLSFLGPETSPNVFRYIEDPADYRKVEAIARKFNNDKARFQINLPFHGYLELEDGALSPA
jgi:hypothetical protein